MSTGDEVFRRIQSAARAAGTKVGTGAPTQEYLIRHTLESFLDRFSRTAHAEDFVLKGGILLAAYGVRRPTKDADANAIGADVTADHLIEVVHDINAIETGDGVTFDLGSLSVQEIREHADYPGFRVRVGASIGPWKGTAPWDVSTGDPIVPAPRQVRIDRILGDPIVLFGYAPETTIAEKGVTILERGITSTRWRDYVDIVQLGRQGIDSDELFRSALAVARYRGVTLEPVAPHVVGYGRIGQAKWAAWRRKERLEAVCEADLDEQMALVSSYLDPVFDLGDTT
ncbi:nucleotidyl transferase AbiEii/AbiGii toxin family protein [Brevibacterium casei]|uniref:nucleotidyl transferase AbiEii/AbiGii toxin family protein n=1 Tax=Brevibacterium casei TaxID=33889 RepID=UPI00344BB310